MNMKNIGIWICILVASGCNRPGGVPSVESPPRQTINSTSFEWFIYIAEGLPTAQKQEILNEIGHLLNRAAVGDCIHIIRCPDHVEIGSVTVPAGNRRGDRTLGTGVQQIIAMLKDQSKVPDAIREQLNLPMLVDSFWAARRTELPAKIVLCGTPLHFDQRDTAWDFRSGAPSPSSLTNPDSTLPHRLLTGTAPFPEAEIRWLTPTERFGKSIRHEEALSHFYQNLFSSYQAKLVAMASNASVIFQESSTSQFPEYHSGDDRMPPCMVEFPPAGVPLRKNSTAVVSPLSVQSLSTLLEAAQSDSSKTLIAISWSGPADTDIDLWMGSNTVSGGEIMFQTPARSFGVLHRDIRSPLAEQLRTASAISDVESAWEAISLTPGQPLNDCNLYLNAYEAIGPVSVKMLIVVGGKLHQADITIPCAAGGDRAQNRDLRDTHSAWVKVDLLGVVGQSQNEE